MARPSKYNWEAIKEARGMVCVKRKRLKRVDKLSKRYKDF